MTVGENIKYYRKEKGLTQKKLGSLCGMNEVQIRQYELGKANPKLETIKRIADALSINYLFIVGDDELENVVKENTIINSDTEFTNAWDNFLISNNIHFMSFEKDGVPGMLLTFTDTNESYFLTQEQAENLPELSIEQTKLLIKAMGKAEEDE